jgi:hypothetical protein
VAWIGRSRFAGACTKSNARVPLTLRLATLDATRSLRAGENRRSAGRHTQRRYAHVSGNFIAGINNDLRAFAQAVEDFGLDTVTAANLHRAELGPAPGDHE